MHSRHRMMSLCFQTSAISLQIPRNTRRVLLSGQNFDCFSSIHIKRKSYITNFIISILNACDDVRSFFRHVATKNIVAADFTKEIDESLKRRKTILLYYFLLSDMKRKKEHFDKQS